MTKHKTKTKFDEWDFKTNIERRQENVAKLQEAIEKNSLIEKKFELQIKEIKYQLALPDEKFAPMKQEFPFESSIEWITLFKDPLAISLAEAEQNKKRIRFIIDTDMTGLRNEELRVLFMTQNIPAWIDAEFENAKRKYESEP